MQTRTDRFIAEAHARFAIAQPTRPNPWSAMLPRSGHGEPPAYDSLGGLRGRGARDTEEGRSDRIDTIIALLDGLSDEDGAEVADRMRRKLGADRARRAMDRLRGRDEERDATPSAAAPYTNEELHGDTVRRLHARDQAIARVRKGGHGHLAMDTATSAGDVYKRALRAEGVDVLGLDGTAAEAVYRARVLARAGGAPPVAMDAGAEISFERMYGSATRASGYPNDLSWGR